MAEPTDPSDTTTETAPPTPVDTATLEYYKNILRDITEGQQGLTEEVKRTNSALQDLKSPVLESFRAQTEQWRQSLDGVRQSTEQVNAAQKGLDSSSVLKMSSDATKAGGEFSAVAGNLSKIPTEGAKAIQTTSSPIVASLLSGAGNLKSLINQVAKYFDTNVDRVGQALGSTAIFAGLKSYRKQFEEPLSILGGRSASEVEKPLLDIKNTVLTTGQSFGRSFAGSSGSVDKVIGDYRRLGVASLASQEEITAVHKSLASTLGAVSPGEPFSAVKGLESAFRNVSGPASAANAALQIHNATGMSSAKITEAMGTAFQHLGQDTAGAVKMFGTVRDAAQQSGLGFEKTMDIMMNGASSLKYFGGTVESVAPTFNAFSRAMREQGFGRQGLTKELFETYVEGIRKMDLGTRALLGLQSAGGGGKGALRSGLEMEAAMSEGPKGMEKISSSLIDTLKKFGGGAGILTIKQAIETPGMERQFVAQRQLLGQLLNISDTGQQNKILEMLQSVDKNGFKANANASAQLNEMIQGGKDTKEQTTTLADQIKAREEAAGLVSSEQLIKGLKEVFEGGKLEGATKIMNTAVDKFIIDGGGSMKLLTKALTDMKAAATGANLSGLEKSLEEKALKGTLESPVKKETAPPAAPTLTFNMEEEVGKLSKSGGVAGPLVEPPARGMMDWVLKSGQAKAPGAAPPIPENKPAARELVNVGTGNIVKNSFADNLRTGLAAVGTSPGGAPNIIRSAAQERVERAPLQNRSAELKAPPAATSAEGTPKVRTEAAASTPGRMAVDLNMKINGKDSGNGTATFTVVVETGDINMDKQLQKQESNLYR